MNERIKEMYGRSVLFVFENKVGVEGPKETLQEAINDKFAEMIIKECMVLTSGFTHPRHNQTGSNRIAGYFGIPNE